MSLGNQHTIAVVELPFAKKEVAVGKSPYQVPGSGGWYGLNLLAKMTIAQGARLSGVLRLGMAKLEISATTSEVTAATEISTSKIAPAKVATAEPATVVIGAEITTTARIISVLTGETLIGTAIALV